MVAAGKTPVEYVDPVTTPSLVVSPLVVVPKEGSTGRVCHDLSADQEFSVNGSMCTAPWEPLHLLQPGGRCDTCTLSARGGAGGEGGGLPPGLGSVLQPALPLRAPAPFLHPRWVVHARAGVSSHERGV
jgi:hypothetical protein